MSGDREENERERKTPGLLDGLVIAGAGVAMYMAYLTTRERNEEMAETLLEVHERETVEHFQQERQKLAANGESGGQGDDDGAIPVDAKPRNLPKALKPSALKQITAKLAKDPLWQYCLGKTVGTNLEWIIRENMESLEKVDKKADVTSVAWRSAYQALLTRRYREGQELALLEDAEASPLDVVATFVVHHGSDSDPIFDKKSYATGLSAEQNRRLLAVGSFLQNVKLKHFFGKKPNVVEITRLVTNPNFEEKGIESICVGQIMKKTRMPVLLVTQIEKEKDHYVNELGFQLIEAAVYTDGDESFTSYFLIKED